MRYLDLAHNTIDSRDVCNIPVNSLVSINLEWNNFTVIHQHNFRNFTNLRHLSLLNNQIAKVSSHSFYGLHALKLLNLSNVGITTIASCAFCGMRSLVELDLKNNVITKLKAAMFNQISNKLTLLDITNNSFIYVEYGMFGIFSRDLHMKKSDRRLCCFYEQKMLTDNQECWKVSHRNVCTRLLPPRHGVAYLALACLVVVTNVLMLSYYGGQTKTQLQTIFFQGLAIFDLIFSIYLLSMYTIDLQYKHQFILSVDQWKHSYFLRSITIYLVNSSCHD